MCVYIYIWKHMEKIQHVRNHQPVNKKPCRAHVLSGLPRYRGIHRHRVGGSTHPEGPGIDQMICNYHSQKNRTQRNHLKKKNIQKK